MKQTIAIALVSFLAAVGGSTWYTAYLSTPRPVPVPLAESGRPASPPSVKPAPAEGPTAPTDSGSPSVQRSLPAHSGPSPAELAAGVERAKAVAKVVAAMKPKEAIGILERLTDDEVERIVRQLNPKQMAALLGAMPTERAALLGRRLLQPGSEP
ncbi:MAG: magnesium transporter MgtE N-terminal domain-containing protein [Gemmatimonadales bacterium]